MVKKVMLKKHELPHHLCRRRQNHVNLFLTTTAIVFT